jgi:hypothetical protein
VLRRGAVLNGGERGVQDHVDVTVAPTAVPPGGTGDRGHHGQQEAVGIRVDDDADGRCDGAGAQRRLGHGARHQHVERAAAEGFSPGRRTTEASTLIIFWVLFESTLNEPAVERMS